MLGSFFFPFFTYGREARGFWKDVVGAAGWFVFVAPSLLVGLLGCFFRCSFQLSQHGVSMNGCDQCSRSRSTRETLDHEEPNGIDFLPFSLCKGLFFFLHHLACVILPPPPPSLRWWPSLRGITLPYIPQKCCPRRVAHQSIHTGKAHEVRALLNSGLDPLDDLSVFLFFLFLFECSRYILSSIVPVAGRLRGLRFG